MDAKGPKSKVSMHLVKSQSTVPSMSVNAIGRSSLSRMKVRKHSFGFTGVPGIRPVERTSQIAMEYKRPQMLFFPTYQLDSHDEWHVPTVTKICDAILDEIFTGHKYNVVESPTTAIRVAGEVMRRVKALNYNRYRVIAVCTVGQKRAQSYNNAITFLWDHERDNYVDLQREVTTAFIQVTVFGVYLD